jgi:hypothetical protein
LKAEPRPALPPELTTPPAEAQARPDGIRVTYLKRGQGKRKPAAADVVEFMVSAWYLDGDVKGDAVARERVFKTKLGSAPYNTALLVKDLVEGDAVRAWVPPGLGVPATRGPAEVPMVVEVLLMKIY